MREFRQKDIEQLNIQNEIRDWIYENWELGKWSKRSCLNI